MCAAGRARGWVAGWVSVGWVGLLKRYKGGEGGGEDDLGKGEMGKMGEIHKDIKCLPVGKSQSKD